MRIPYEELKAEFKRVLLNLSFSEDLAETCAGIFAGNSRDGVYSHGLNRFPVFVDVVKKGLVKPDAAPVLEDAHGALERWNGNYAPGIANATHCMDRAIKLAKQYGIGCVSIKDTNHWMRGGTYGWQAADAGCIGICFTNAIANMPAWGGKTAVLGNNPMVIAVPRADGHVVLDMAMSLYSYGKMQQYELDGKELPFDGGFDIDGEMTRDPAKIRESKLALPIGFWKGSGLALVLDLLAVALSGGSSTEKISERDDEAGICQCFVAIHRPDLHAELLDRVIEFTKSSEPKDPERPVAYPGENTLKTRKESEEKGVIVNEEMWNELKSL